MSIFINPYGGVDGTRTHDLCGFIVNGGGIGDLLRDGGRVNHLIRRGSVVGRGRDN